jgi:hypothetical protein
MQHISIMALRLKECSPVSHSCEIAKQMLWVASDSDQQDQELENAGCKICAPAKGLATAVARRPAWHETTGQDAPGTIKRERQAGSFFLLRYFYLGKFSLDRGNDRGVLRLSRAPRQSIPRMGGVRDRIFSGAFFHEVRFRKFFSRGSS